MDSKIQIRERYLEVDAANVADVLDDLGLRDQGLDPDFNAVSGTKVAGWAYTITGHSVPFTTKGDPVKMRACEGIGAAEVSVWTGEGRGVCYFGELIALGMQERGSVGALVDGGVRDTQALRTHEYPVFARFQSAVQSIGRWKVRAWQEPISVRGATRSLVTVTPGDFVLADVDGGVVIPEHVVLEVLERAEEMTRQEIEIRTALKSGMSLGDALKKFEHI
jgi:regulator of RNase E activity RraA